MSFYTNDVSKKGMDAEDDAGAAGSEYFKYRQRIARCLNKSFTEPSTASLSKLLSL